MTTSDYITIPLSKTGKYKGLYEAVVSPEDADLAELNWYVKHSNRTQYAHRKTEKVQIMHRVIVERMIGRELHKGEVPDHIDGNGLNNQRNNLRVVTVAQNVRNARLSKNNTSGYKGVCWNKRTDKWQAQITINRKCIVLGQFDDKKEAYKAYCDAANEHHGKYANHGKHKRE